MDEEYNFGGGLGFNSGEFGGSNSEFAREEAARRAPQDVVSAPQDAPAPGAIQAEQRNTPMPPTQPEGGFFGAIKDVVGGVMGGVGSALGIGGAQAQTSGRGGMFGSGMIMPGPLGRPSYQTDPNASPADAAASMIKQRIERASAVASNPFVQLFNPAEAQRAQQFMMQAPAALAQIKTQEATVAANLNQAKILGLTPGEGGTTEYSTQEQRVQVAQQRAIGGDLNAFRGLQTVDPKAAESIQDRVYESVAGHIGNANVAFDKLSQMTTPREYDEAVKQLRGNGTLTDLESMGMKVPSFDQFQQQKAGMGRTLRETQQGVNRIGTQLKERNSFIPMEKKEAETYTGTFKTAYGDVIDAGPMSRNQASGVRGMTIQGMDDPRNLGKTFVLGNIDQRKALREEFDAALPKAQYEKYREFTRTYGLATTDAKGNPMPAGQINTNPNVQQGIAEGLAATLRGGTGGANVGLLKIELSKRGWSQGVIDGFTSNWAGVANTLNGDQVKPYLSKITQEQQRDVLDFIKTYEDKHVRDVVGGVAERAGALGFDPSVFGMGKKEGGGLADIMEVGRENQIGRLMPYHRSIGSGNGVLMVDPQTAGSPSPVGSPQPTTAGGGIQSPSLPARGAQETQAAALPPGQPGSYGDASKPIPGENDIRPKVAAGGYGTAPAATGPAPNLNAVPQPASFQRAQAPALGGGPGSAPLATGPQVASVGGQNVTVNVPPGASTGYVGRMQAIESGGTKDPWRATTGASSASGAFQFINDTWERNKPPGAPARAKDATPQQQVQALEKFTARNAQVLGARGLPVNDGTLYMAHNLGADGAAKLLKADPSADAASVVGAKVAANNPKFFSGGATVAQAVQRYNAAMGGSVGGTPSGGGVRMPASVSGAPPSAAMSPEDQVAASQARFDQAAQDRYAEQRARMGAAMEGTGTRAAEMIPAAASTAGAVAGGIGGAAVGGPAGAVAGGVAGGAVGGAGGQMLKDWLQGSEQNPGQIAKEAALGGVLGVVPAGRPIVGAAARVAGVAGIEGGEAALEGKKPSEIAEAAGKGALVGAAGETFGRALGMAGHKLFSTYAPAAQAELQTLGRELGEARGVLGKMEPKLPTGGPNPAYQAAETKAKAAETRIKDMGQDPEAVAYAAKAVEEGVPRAEAKAARPVETERARIGQEYQQMREDVGQKGVGAPKPVAKLPDGPVAQVESGKVSKKHLEEAERTEMAITAPAKSWQDKWTQLADERSRLLTLERDALTSTSKGRSSEATDMRRLADSVRTQQEKVAKVVFGPTEGAKVIERLKALDVRYRKVMEATDGDILKAAGKRGEDGRAADRAFKAFAAGDPEALKAWEMLRREAGGAGIHGANGAMHVARDLPLGVGKVAATGQMAVKLINWMRGQSAGSPVRFKDLVEVPTVHITGQAGATGNRALTMQ